MFHQLYMEISRGRQRVAPSQPIAYYRDESIDWEAPCKVCGSDEADDKNDMLFCDCCNMAFHMLCHKPIIRPEELLQDTWFCSPCRLRYKGVRVQDWAGCPARLGGLEDEFSDVSFDSDDVSASEAATDDELNEENAYTRISAMINLGDQKGLAGAPPQGDVVKEDPSKYKKKSEQAADEKYNHIPKMNVSRVGGRVAEVACEAAEASRLAVQVIQSTGGAPGAKTGGVRSKQTSTRPLELHEQLLLLPEKHSAEKKRLLERLQRDKVPYWTALVRGGVPLCLWGVGSKGHLLDLVASRLDDSVVLSVNGADPSTDFKEALGALVTSEAVASMSSTFAAASNRRVTDGGHSLRASTVELLKQLESPGAAAVTLVLHNIDGPCFQPAQSSNQGFGSSAIHAVTAAMGQAQQASVGVARGGPLDIVQRLIKHPKVRVIASADVRDLPVRVGRWWFVEEVHTWVDYRVELISEGSGAIPSWLGFGRSANSALTTVTERANVVMKSLTDAHRKLVSRMARVSYIYLLDKTLQEGKPVVEWPGLTESELLTETKDSGIAVSAKAVQSLLKELKDHDIVAAGEGGRYTLPVLGRRQLKELMNDVDSKHIDEYVGEKVKEKKEQNAQKNAQNEANNS